MNTKQMMICAGLITASIFASSAQANVIGDSASFSFSSIAFYDNNPGKIDDKPIVQKRINRRTLFLDRFDESLGTLTGVDIWFETDWSLTSTVHSADIRRGNRTATGKGRSISNQKIRLIDPWKALEKNNEVLKSNCRDKPSCRDTDTASGEYDGSFDLAAFTLADFIGINPLEFRVIRTLTADLMKCGALDRCWQKNSNNAWSGTVYVDYTYTVPEPSTLALLGLGLAGMGAGRRMKRRKS